MYGIDVLYGIFTWAMKKPGWLGYKGWETTQLYGDDIISDYKDPY